MPRPVEFDQAKALVTAMDLFWAYGYEATSVRDLLEHMELLSGSLYNAFGDKHSLYLRALQLYAEQALAHATALLDAPGSPLGNIRTSFMEIVDWPNETKARGSMICNALGEVAPRDQEVAGLTYKFLRDAQEVFQRTLNRAKEEGELPSTANTTALACYLTSSIQGLCITAKAGVSREELAQIVEVTMNALR